MDWNSDEGRALLWKAYPAGFLDVRGVFTLGGFLCTGINQRWLYPDAGGAPSGRKHDPSHAIFEQYRLHGDLLPLPDPNDPATWACLLVDLWEACPAYVKGPAPTGHTWHRFGRAWILSVVLCDGRSLGGSFNIDTDDPAEALVRARIALREAVAAAAPSTGDTL